MDTPEKRLMNEIRLWCGQRGYPCWHCNVGTFYDGQGNRVSTGLPVGFSDLLILTPKGAKFVETKVKPRKPTKEQLNFIEQVKALGYGAGVAYSLQEAERIIEG